MRVHRWQDRDGQEPNGHYEDGVVTEILVEVRGVSTTTSPARVGAVDLRPLRLQPGMKKRFRPAVGIVMRSNVYWMQAYLIESLESARAWPPDPPPVQKEEDNPFSFTR